MKPIELHGLTQEQIDLLDIMWSITDSYELEAWEETLSPRERSMAHGLQLMLVQETAEQLLIDDPKIVALAKATIDRARYQ